MKLLYIDCCISVHEVSRTKLLADTFLSAWRAAHPQDEIETLDLKNLELQPLTLETLTVRETALEEKRYDDPALALARQFAAADRIVIAAPYWEMSFPSRLRVYIEHVSASGITFGYADGGQSLGLCRAGKLLYLTTAGGPIEGANYGGDYLKAISRFFGIEDFHFLGAPMQDVIELDHEAILRDTLKAAVALALTF